MRDNIHRTFGSSLSLRLSWARSSSKDLPHLEGRSSISSQLALPQIAVADVLYDSNGGKTKRIMFTYIWCGVFTETVSENNTSLRKLISVVMVQWITVFD